MPHLWPFIEKVDDMKTLFPEKMYHQMRRNLFLIDPIQHFKVIEKKKSASPEKILLFLRERCMRVSENAI
jgi:hypothetical protein